MHSQPQKSSQVFFRQQKQVRKKGYSILSYLADLGQIQG